MKINSTYKTIGIILITTFTFSRSVSVENSWKFLLNNDERKIHATLHINNILKNGAAPIEKERNDLLNKLGIIFRNDRLVAIAPVELDEQFESENFIFHYTTDQSNSSAVSILDLDNNNSPDYVESMSSVFDSVWSFYTLRLGFDQPVTIDQNGNIGKYNIYLKNLPSNYFAVVYASSYLNNTETSCGSYMEMRNNYDAPGFQDLTEIENIRITAVHEFFHAVQFFYNCQEEYWLMEATAVWSEDELYDDINDHYRYMPNWFSNSDRSINNESDPFHKYGSFILFQYIDEHIGGPEIIKEIWVESRKRRNPHTDVSITSIDAALSNVGYSFNIALNSMRIANRIMSNHQNAEPYTYEEASSYPVSGPNSIATLTFNKSEQINISQNSLLLYSSHYYDLDINSPLKISIQNNSGPISDLFISTISKYSNSERWIIRHGNEINIDPEIGLEWSSLMINAQNKTINNWDYSISLSNGSSEGFVISGIYPNPFIRSTVNSIITIKIFSSIEQDAIVNIYNMLGQKFINWKIEIPQGKEKDVHWDIKNSYRKSIANGIYFIEIKGKNSNYIEKITVLKSSN